MLDAGAHGVIVPDVVDAVQAEAIVAAMRHPPRGVRSRGTYGYDATGYSGAEPRTSDALCYPMIESRAGVDQAARIARVAGVDGLYVGRRDLALDLGVEVAEVSPGGRHHDAIRQVRAACDAVGIPMASTGPIEELAREGFRMVTLGSELDLLRAAVREGVGS